MMSETGARTCTTSIVTGADLKKCSRIYRELHKRSSPSGQTGNDDQWYIKNTERIFAGSFFLAVMEEVSQNIKSKNEAFIHAYWLFWKMMGSPDVEEQKTLPFNCDRASFLMLNNKNSDSLNMRSYKLYKCKICSTKFLGNGDKDKCPFCEPKS